MVGVGPQQQSYSHTPTWRERAVEALLDRDPNGSILRAASVVDEAISVAHANRPNLITKAALVDQAMSLGVYCVDTVEKYDAEDAELNKAGVASSSHGAGAEGTSMKAASASEEASTPVASPSTSVIFSPSAPTASRLKPVDALTRERILLYQAKVLASKQATLATEAPASLAISGSATISSVTAGTTGSVVIRGLPLPTTNHAPSLPRPPATLVAALRQVFDDEMPSPSSLAPFTDGEQVDTAVAYSQEVAPASSSSATINHFELRQFLRTVTSHRVFHGSNPPASVAATSTTSTSAPSSERSSASEVNTDSSRKVAAPQPETATVDSGTTFPLWQVNLEVLLMHLTQMTTQHYQDEEDEAYPSKIPKVEEERLQALLITALTLVTTVIGADPVTSGEEAESSDGVGKQPQRLTLPGSRRRRARGDRVPSRNVRSAVPSTTVLPEDEPNQKVLLAAGSLLSLWSVSSEDHGRLPKVSSVPWLELDQSLLEYWGEAAACYEARAEIQKARLLARMQAPPPQPATSVLRNQERDSTLSPGGEGDESRSVRNDASLIIQPSSPNQRELIQANSLGEGQSTQEGRSQPESSLGWSSSDQDNILADSIAQVRLDDTEIAEPGGTRIDVDDQRRTGGEDNVDTPLVASSSEVDRLGDEERQAAELSLRTAFEQVAAQIMRQLPGEHENEAQPAENEIDASASESSDEDDDDGETDDELPYEEHENDEDEGVGESGQAASGSEGMNPDEDDEDGDDDSEEEEESSSEDGAALESDRGLETDDDEDVMFRRVLALSIADHEAAAENERGRTTVEGSHNPLEEEQQPIADDPVNISGSANPLADSLISGIHFDGEEKLDSVASDANDKDLPPLPRAPSVYPFLGVGFVAPQDPDAGSPDRTRIAFFDPASPQYGLLPASHVILHLLRHTLVLAERRRYSRVSNSAQPSVVTGGMGSQLFAPSRSSCENMNGDSDAALSSRPKIDLSLQLLIACLFVFGEKRNEASESLRKAYIREERAAQGHDFETDDDEAVDTTSRRQSPAVEEDDPALTFALNYVEDDASLSLESLENKGLGRKAAAAAYDQASLMKALRIRTVGWKEKVQLYSQGLAYLLRVLRLYMQTALRQQLQIGDQDQVALVCNTLESHSGLPSAVPAKLSQLFGSLMSPSLHMSHLASTGGDSSELEDVFLATKLYREALATWGECLPIIYNTVAQRIDALQSLVRVCSPCFKTDHVELDSVELLSTFPRSEQEINLHRLETLCRRFRVIDLLNGLVPRLMAYYPERKGDRLPSTLGLTRGVHNSSSLVLMVGNLVSVSGLDSELGRLYFALCHQFHANVLLTGTSGSGSGSESNERLPATSGGKVLSTADVLRVGMSPSSSFVFDGTRCSDSIALIPGNYDQGSSSSNGPSVHQRASKVWGTVLSTISFAPRSGTHRWAVRLDKCERSHVFVGVATAQASIRTYVGGDKYGWGMIGTQALWHDRRKIRGDYGAQFRTGSIIIVALDTDAGTLSYSSWKDSSNAPPFSVDSTIHSLLSPRRHSHVSGAVEDWGVAFEGLPLDSRLYPAVGLYQRDDRVTLLPVESSQRSHALLDGEDITGGLVYWPLPASDEEVDDMEKIRRFNDQLTWESIVYAVGTLRDLVPRNTDSVGDARIRTVLPSLSAALCLLPSVIPVLATRSALTLMPHLSRSIRDLERLILSRQLAGKSGLRRINEGRWVIRATGSSGVSKEVEEYLVDIMASKVEVGASSSFDGRGVGTIGKSKNGRVTISGYTAGSLLTFIEEWSDGSTEARDNNAEEGSSCVVSARLSLDGSRFEGRYRNVQFGTTGVIVGIRTDAINSKWEGQIFDWSLILGQALLCLAEGHFASLATENIIHDLAFSERSGALAAGASRNDRMIEIGTLLNAPLFATCGRKFSDVALNEEIESLRRLYSPPSGSEVLEGLCYSHVLDQALASVREKRETVEVLSESSLLAAKTADAALAPLTGGHGSLRGMCAIEYDATRLGVIRSLLYFTGLYRDLEHAVLVETTGKNLLSKFGTVWNRALTIVEDGVRRFISGKNPSRREASLRACELYSSVSTFLLSLEKEETRMSQLSLDRTLAEIARFYRSMESDGDLQILENLMDSTSKRAFVRYATLAEIASLADSTSVPIALESLLHSLPRIIGLGLDGRRLSQKAGEALEGSCPSDTALPQGLVGSPLIFRACHRRAVISAFRVLGEALRKAGRGKKQLSNGSDVSYESLILATLAALAGTLRSNSLSEYLSASGLLDELPIIISDQRVALLPLDDDVEMNVTETLERICHRDLARTILRTGVPLVHLVISSVHDGDVESSFAAKCAELLLKELAFLFPFMEHENQEASKAYGDVCRDQDWLLSQQSTFPSQLLETQTRSRASPGLCFLREHGSMPGMISYVSSSKLNTNRTSINGPYIVSRKRNGFSGQLLSQWLHVLCEVLRSAQIRSLVASDDRWLTILLRAVGLSKQDGSTCTGLSLRKRTEGWLQARFRTRVLRLLLPLLSFLDPDESIIEGLFALVGFSSPARAGRGNDDEDDELFASREAASLIRNLHTPSLPLWRRCVHNVIDKVFSQSIEGSSAQWKQIGVQTFFSGAIDGLRRGSYVLLKPPSAAALFQESHSTVGSKNQSGSSSSSVSLSVGTTPHHVVGNGTESVMCGLGRNEAPAGVVSNIDLKNGVCEVIAVVRTETSFEIDDIPYSCVSASSKAQTITVRALRAPVADTVQALEVPLWLDPSVPVEYLVDRMMDSSIKSLISSHTPQQVIIPEGTNELISGGQVRVDLQSSSTAEGGDNDRDMLRSGVVSLVMDLMTIRSCTVLVSDPRILASFCSRNAYSTIMMHLLALAWPEDTGGTNANFIRDARQKPLSSLSVHEGRLSHLLTMTRELAYRETQFELTSEEVWRDRLQRLGMRGQATDGDLSISSAVSRMGSATNNSESSLHEARNMVAQRSTVPSTGGSLGEDGESEAAATAAAHLREVAIAQMAELGLPRSWSEFALRRTGGVNNIEAAVTFCLERGAEIERLLQEERERERASQNQTTGTISRQRDRDLSPSNHLLRQLMEMGFPRRWCNEALAVTGNNVDEALTWILNNGERLSEEDEGMDADGAGDADDGEEDSVEEEEDDDDTDGESRPPDCTIADLNVDDAETREEVPNTPSERGGDCSAWTGSIVPLRFISGRSLINPETLEISGLPTGGFSSVGTKGILLSSGKWYYEAVLETAGCLQIGWADGSFAGHCHAERGDGCGDGPSSWAYDGWRRYRWHATATEWGCRWKEGDVVGCLVDMDEYVVSFTLNGEGESVGMGVAFSGEGFRPCSGVYACVSFNRREKLRLILGGHGSEPFRYPPPAGYRGVGDAVLEATDELERLVQKENILQSRDISVLKAPRKFLCDFSDGEHGHELMAWAHRYYGSDASVHLGTGRVKQGSSTSKPTVSNAGDLNASRCLSRRLEKAWSSLPTGDASKITDQDFRKKMRDGFRDVRKKLYFDVFNECRVLGILLARKLFLHWVVSSGGNLDLSSINEELPSLLKLWNIVEVCGSLRSVGWVGEAGAMAIAAESLGLGITSNDQNQNKSMTDRAGVTPANDLEDGLSLPICGVSQLLTSVMQGKSTGEMISIAYLPAAAAENAICSGGGSGLMSFLIEGLQAALRTSSGFRLIVIAAVRRSVRLLAVVEYDADDCDRPEEPDQDEDDGEQRKPPSSSSERSPSSLDATAIVDARLASYLTGLLLSVRDVSGFNDLLSELVEAWSVGLLSASLPWRMVCAFTVAGILSVSPAAVMPVLTSLSTVARFYNRLPSIVARRMWAERAAYPVCSRYAQSLVELLASVRDAVSTLPNEFRRWSNFRVDAATPLPLPRSLPSPTQCMTLAPGETSWEIDEGWVSSDLGWDVWTGVVEYSPVNWKAPLRSTVRSLMDGGDGPPLLRPGCVVMRGVDWESSGTGVTDVNEDGRDTYDTEKAKREKDKRASEAKDKPSSGELETNPAETPALPSTNPADETDYVADTGALSSSLPTRVTSDTEIKSKKKRKIPSPKLPIGTVLSIEEWKGVPAVGRRVKWHLTGVEGSYRYGGDGGRFDICHVETNDRATRVKKKHPLPESAEQCAARHGFGAKRNYNVILRLRKGGSGVLEWPDFGAGVLVSYSFNGDNSVSVEERSLLFGSKDSGWEARFGQPAFVPGTVFRLSLSSAEASQDAQCSTYQLYEEWIARSTFAVTTLRNPANGDPITVNSTMKIIRGKRPNTIFGRDSSSSSVGGAPLPPLRFDPLYHAPSIGLSRDGRTVTCISSDGRGTAFASTGFSKGVHYWEVKIEHADIGSIFIGVAEKTSGSGSGASHGYEAAPRLNRWHGWGFVNFRATYTSGAERVYGAHCHSGDTVGVLLDCDAGRLSFFFDGLKYGEHILNDLGCAFENLSPFGFNVDGCGSGGAGQGAPSGVENGRSSRYPAHGAVRPRTLWPVVGLRNQGDRVTLSPKWITSYGIDGVTWTNNVLTLDEITSTYLSGVNDMGTPFSQGRTSELSSLGDVGVPFSKGLLSEAFAEFKRWQTASSVHTTTRGCGSYPLTTFGQQLILDAAPIACAASSASLGLDYALLPGDRVRLTRSAGRKLELAEEAIVLGSYQGRLYYRIVSQKSEGGSLAEGGGRAWCWDESEVVDGLPFVDPGSGLGVALPRLTRFQCTFKGGLKVVYEGGAVIRSDLEIYEGSMNLGSIPTSTIIPTNDVLERRVNSCGVVRYRVRFGSIEGWISGRIRGESEDLIVEGVDDNTDSFSAEQSTRTYESPFDAAEEWHRNWTEQRLRQGSRDNSDLDPLNIEDEATFCKVVAEAGLPHLTVIQTDSLLTLFLDKVSKWTSEGDSLQCTFRAAASALSYALISTKGIKFSEIFGAPNSAKEAAASLFADLPGELPSPRALLARLSVIRALNRRIRYSLPWMSLRPCQEGSAMFGGLSGHGTSISRTGRSKLVSSLDSWTQMPSIAGRMRALRGLVFSSVKLEFFQGLADVTATGTPLSHDEYELPREIRTVRVNRLKAGRAMASDDPHAKRKHSVFAQLQGEIKNWGGAALRRGYVAKGHGGQKRAFKVKLIGEGVNDYSGPYREVFTDAMGEIVQFDRNGQGVLGVLDPTPNNFGSIGENRDTFMFSLNGMDVNRLYESYPEVSTSEKGIRRSFASLLGPRDECTREVEESLVFLGRLTGTAFRHGIHVDLPLPLECVWRMLTEEPVTTRSQINEIDRLAYNQLSDVEEPEGVPLILWQHRMVNLFAEGLSHVLPVEVLPLFHATELRDAICGNPDVDVNILRRVVEYEGYNSTDPVITFFWDTLYEMTNDERKKFLQFVWARKRLPLSELGFETPFKIQKDTVNVNERADHALPSASTCFFSLTLPEYSSQAKLRQKLVFAICNVTTMETDFQTNSAEIAEGYRAL